jgi:hypothetical protein
VSDGNFRRDFFYTLFSALEFLKIFRLFTICGGRKKGKKNSKSPLLDVGGFANQGIKTIRLFGKICEHKHKQKLRDFIGQNFHHMTTCHRWKLGKI